MTTLNLDKRETFPGYRIESRRGGQHKHRRPWQKSYWPVRTGIFNAFYSPSQAARAGTSFYRKPNGDVVEVSEVSSGIRLGLWKDAVNLGRVTRFVRVGRRVRDDHFLLLSSVPAA